MPRRVHWTWSMPQGQEWWGGERIWHHSMNPAQGHTRLPPQCQISPAWHFFKLPMWHPLALKAGMRSSRSSHNKGMPPFLQQAPNSAASPYWAMQACKACWHAVRECEPKVSADTSMLQRNTSETICWSPALSMQNIYQGDKGCPQHCTGLRARLKQWALPSSWHGPELWPDPQVIGQLYSDCSSWNTQDLQQATWA